MKRHAREPFYRWLASWAMTLTMPSDLGYANDGYELPPLAVTPVILDTAYQPTDRLFHMGLKGIG
mgnify:CR=1 FL=1